VPLEPGDVIEIVTTGGGGWGDPLERDPELVRRDVVREVVSEAAARSEYGVVLRDDADRSVDVAATERLRGERRGPVRMFDRGPYFEQLLAQGLVRRPPGWEDPDSVDET
jgi:N-methylhydantoinase B